MAHGQDGANVGELLLPVANEIPNALDVFIARQPISTTSMDLYGYELLFRSGPRDEFGSSDGVAATSEVVCNSICSLAENRLTRGMKAFVNLPREFLLDDRLEVVSPEILVLEILETVEPDSAVVSACKRWRNRGYLLALDDFSREYFGSPLTGIVDIVKVDFRTTSATEQATIVSRYARKGLQFLAEKVETEEEFVRAQRLGYSFFQGYFFAKPTVAPDRQVPGVKIQYLRILEEANREDLNINRVCQLISEDVSLTCKLLAFVNSAAFRIRGTVRSIKQAVVLLGEHGIRRWITLAVLMGMAVDRPGELVINALVRARFAESMARLLGARQRSDEFFLMGMLSRVDAIVGVPLAKVLVNIDLSPDVNSALLGVGKGMPQRVLEILSLYERAEWESLRLCAASEHIQQSEMTAAHRNALAWADNILTASAN